MFVSSHERRYITKHSALLNPRGYARGKALKGAMPVRLLVALPKTLGLHGTSHRPFLWASTDMP
eukprot:4350333-Amphidinium_carterae.1